MVVSDSCVACAGREMTGMHPTESLPGGIRGQTPDSLACCVMVV